MRNKVGCTPTSFIGGLSYTYSSLCIRMLHGNPYSSHHIYHLAFSPMIVLIGVSLSHFLTSYPLIILFFHPKYQRILLALIHCMSVQSRKGEDQFDLYLTSGLGTSQNKIPKGPCVKFSRLSSQQLFSIFML